MKKLFKILFKIFDFAGRLEADGSIPYDGEELVLWVMRPYVRKERQL